MSDIIQKLTDDSFLIKSLKQQLLNSKFEDNIELCNRKPYIAYSEISHIFTYVEKDLDHLKSVLQQYKMFYEELYFLLHDKAIEYLKNKHSHGKFSVYVEHEETYNKIIETILFCIEAIMRGDTVDSVDFANYLNQNTEENEKIAIRVSSYICMMNRNNEYFVHVLPKVELLSVEKDEDDEVHYFLEEELLAFEISNK